MDEFLNEYKQLEKLCSEIYYQQHGISAYIEDMENTPLRYTRCIPGWSADLSKLKRIRHIRNAMVHDTSVNENDYSPEDLKFVILFHQRIMDNQDPLALLRELQSESSEHIPDQDEVAKIRLANGSEKENEKKTNRMADIGKHDHWFWDKTFLALLIIAGIILLIIAVLMKVC